MPLTIDTGPRIFLDVKAKGDFDLQVLFTWNEMDFSEAFMIKIKKDEKNIKAGDHAEFTFDHDCNNIVLKIHDDEGHLIESFDLESYTVSRTYIVEGSKNNPKISSHEN